jgi:hypothetical protein
MAKYIDANALGIGKADRNAFTVPEYADGWNSAIEIIENAPTVDAVEVKHGRWISHEGYEECDRCHAKAIYPHNFCPNCGARMDGDTE